MGERPAKDLWAAAVASPVVHAFLTERHPRNCRNEAVLAGLLQGLESGSGFTVQGAEVNRNSRCLMRRLCRCGRPRYRYKQSPAKNHNGGSGENSDKHGQASLLDPSPNATLYSVGIEDARNRAPRLDATC